MATLEQVRAAKPLAKQFAQNQGLDVFSVGLKKGGETLKDSYKISVGVTSIPEGTEISTVIDGVDVEIYEGERPEFFLK